ncbi:MAG: hypothetical protein ABR567_21270 [Myxococcales bacterium]|nr:hypothetical protein [Myxococcales bacterium]
MLALLAAGAAHAHHEAIFGPQSSLVLSSPAFVSLQTFSRTTVSGTETTGLVSAGFTPFTSVPLSFTAIVPATYISPPGKLGREDIILGARYREGLGGEDGNFLMGVAAVDVPTGNIDHKAFDGPLILQAAALASAERRPFSAIAYAYGRRDPLKGNNLFLGTGFAWTPLDDDADGHLFSLQLGASYEFYTSGTELMAHPTIVFAPARRLLFFGVVSLPIFHDLADPAQTDRFRIGGGVLVLLGSNPKA